MGSLGLSVTHAVTTLMLDWQEEVGISPPRHDCCVLHSPTLIVYAAACQPAAALTCFCLSVCLLLLLSPIVLPFLYQPHSLLRWTDPDRLCAC